MRALPILSLLMVLTLTGPVSARQVAEATLYKSPGCECCEGHAEHLRRDGYKVTVVPTGDMPALKRSYGVPTSLEGCHTILVGGYVVEGHVPDRVIDQLLAERPAVRGIALPGMPEGSPGMSGRKDGPFVVYSFGQGEPELYVLD
jgi:hypothetical protein